MKNMAKRCCCTLAVVVLALGGVASSNAQMTAGGGPHAAPAAVSPAMAYDTMLKGFEDEMMGVAKAMPAEKYSFAPSQAIFAASQTTKYEGVRTFGQMIGHIAQANYGIYGRVGGLKPASDVKAIANLTSKDDLVAALQASFEFAHQSIAKLTAENANEGVPGPAVMSRGAMAGYGVAHGFDHYGQLVEYLRMNGIVPPASMK